MLCNSTIIARVVLVFLITSQALALQAQSSDDFDGLARSAMEAQRSGRIEEAVSAYRQALAIRPDWIEGTFYLATIYLGSQRYSEAVPVLKQLTKFRPQDGVPWALLGLSQFQLAQYDDALSSLERGHTLGLQASPQALAQAYYTLGILLNRRGDFSKALAVLKPGAKEGPLAQQMRFALGLNLLQLRLLPSEITPSEMPLIQSAGEVALALSTSHYGQAFKGMEELIKSYPDDPRLRGVYGWSLLNVSRYNEAEVQFREQARIAPNSPSPWIGIAELSLKQQKWNEAKTAATNASKLDPGSGEPHSQLGYALLGLGEVSEAILELEQSVKISPSNPEFHFRLARAYAKAKREDDASREREIFLSLREKK